MESENAAEATATAILPWGVGRLNQRSRVISSFSFFEFGFCCFCCAFRGIFEHSIIGFRTESTVSMHGAETKISLDLILIVWPRKLQSEGRRREETVGKGKKRDKVCKNGTIAK